jgi:hypothetical protein
VKGGFAPDTRNNLILRSASLITSSGNLIVPVFDNASQALDDEWKRESENYKKATGEADKVDEGP